nr:PREDICTED: fat storage-inducing transmembrane protein 2 isoform X3 [Latimeria chalumnae]|eukprot:XP_014346577.1 PREDICTED: fat storage-inducing transmembrane protein 2 isoform X3 [Latimeria chalumnae]
MELIENCACVFSNMFCTTEAVRKNFQWVLVAITVAGSLIKEVQLLPDSYFNYKRNVLNVYFVKLAWGWTLCILLPFIALSNFCVSRDIKIVLKRSSTLVVGTAVWYAFTWLFFYIEDLTGSCFESATMTAVKTLSWLRRKIPTGGDCHEVWVKKGSRHRSYAKDPGQVLRLSYRHSNDFDILEQ